MKADVYYFTEEAHRNNPHDFFMYASKTKDMLDATGLENFRKVGIHETRVSIPLEDFAEEIFARFNLDDNPLGTKEGQDKIRELGVGHTSMSVNDFIVVDGEVLIVDSCGYLNIGKHKAVSEVVA